MQSKINTGFTLIQLLIVISIIIILSGLVLYNVFEAEEKGNLAKVHAEINTLRLAMYMYRVDYKELPPIGDNCSACNNPCGSSWTAVVDALVNEGYLSQRIDKDPWDNYYCYDDNDDICCGGCTPIYSMGPNGVNDSWFNCPRSDGCPQSICKDDIGEILPYGDRSNPW